MGARTKGDAKLKVDPQTVAVISAALTAGGYLNPGDRLVGIRKCNERMNPWKYQGMIEIMKDRDYSLK